MSINNTYANKLSIFSLKEASVFSLDVTSDTYSGFIGILPESLSETHFTLYMPNLRIHNFKSGYQEVAPVPEPTTLLLFISGFAGLVLIKRFRS